MSSPQSGVGIKIQGCESEENLDDSEPSDNDYTELPAITKHFDDNPVTAINGCNVGRPTWVKSYEKLWKVMKINKI